MLPTELPSARQIRRLRLAAPLALLAAAYLLAVFGVKRWFFAHHMAGPGDGGL